MGGGGRERVTEMGPASQRKGTGHPLVEKFPGDTHAARAEALVCVKNCGPWSVSCSMVT